MKSTKATHCNFHCGGPRFADDQALTGVMLDAPFRGILSTGEQKGRVFGWGCNLKRF
ncbi:hypothetical protein [Burkholderia mayonis]|uniref:hypothetical protein n=1 Tax=Burkholderia mayonis TaxID=1385591 RepID=UPI00131EF232|nr:hypothetical protein [Burkholderia mayonis]